MPRLWSIAIRVHAIAAAAVVLSAQAPAPPVQPAGRGLLVGQVVDAGTKKPVADALVTLGGRPSPSGTYVIFEFSQATIPGGTRQTLTDSNGHFVFSEVPAGTFTIQATKPGYVPGGYGKRRATGMPQTITLADGDRIGDISVALSKYSVITGRVTDEAGEPVIGVSVRAMRRIYDSGAPAFGVASSGMSAVTDDRGVYRLGTLVPGEYVVAIPATQATVPTEIVDGYRQAVAAGTTTDFNREISRSGSGIFGSMTSGIPVGNQLLYQPTSFSSQVATPPPQAGSRQFVYPMQFYPAATVTSQASIIALRSGEEKSAVDLQLRPVPTSRISGTVLDSSGPAANVGLTLVHAVTSLSDDIFFSVATTISDGRGSFVFLGVPAGDYLIHVVKVPPAAPVTPNSQVVIPNGPTLWANARVAVDRTDIKDLAIPLQTGFHVSGHTVFEGTTAKPGPDVIRRLSVFVEPADGRAPTSLSVTRGAVDSDGNVSSYEFPPGKYFVRASGSVPGWTLKGAFINGRDVTFLPLELTGSDVTDLMLTYVDRTSTLAGTVRTTAGSADATAQVLVFPVEAVGSGFSGSVTARRFKNVRPGTSGTYDIGTLPEGDYFAIAVVDEAGADFPSLTLMRSLARLATRVRIGPGENKVQDLTTVVVR